MSVPIWIELHKDCKPPCGRCKLSKALTIAWEALEETNIEIAHKGVYCESGKSRPTISPIQDRIVSAMTRIRTLGGEDAE